MEYTQGKLGRVFVARLHDGESIYDEVYNICVREGIRYASVQAMGGIRGATNTTGEGRELVGLGTVVPDQNKPILHFHAGIGLEKEAFIGNPRDRIRVHMLMEVVIMEIMGIDAMRAFDKELDCKVLTIVGKGTDYSEKDTQMKGSLN